MHRSIRRAPLWLGLVAALGLASAAAAQTPDPRPNLWWRSYAEHSRLVSLPDGRQLNLYCEGSGSVTVVLESGLGDGAESWRRVQDALAKLTRVCAYDRAGYGRSPPGPTPRDVNALVGDLEQLLKAAKLPPPYVLVGHSMGGLDARLFAHRCLPDMAGLVLVEPSVEDQDARFEAVAPGYIRMNRVQYALARPCANPARAPAVTAICVHPPADLPPDLVPSYVAGRGGAYFATVIAESDAMAGPDTAEMTAARRPLGALPLVVLTRDDVKPPPGVPESRTGAMLAVWKQMHDEVAGLSTRGSNRIVPRSAHAIQNSNPEVVIAAVREVLEQARGRPNRRLSR